MRRRSKIPEIYVTLLLILMYLPILVVVVYSFNDTKLFSWEGFTFSWYQKLLHNRNIITAFFNSLELAALSSLSASVLGHRRRGGHRGQAFPRPRRARKSFPHPHHGPRDHSRHGVPRVFLLPAPALRHADARARAHHLLRAVHLHQRQGAARRLDPAIGEAARDLGASGAGAPSLTSPCRSSHLPSCRARCSPLP